MRFHPVIVVGHVRVSAGVEEESGGDGGGSRVAFVDVVVVGCT